MNAREKGFLLLCCALGNPKRKVLSAAQLRVLSQRVSHMSIPTSERELMPNDLAALGCGTEMANRIVSLLSEETLLKNYLARARRCGCNFITRGSENYPIRLRNVLGGEAPGCFWFKGDESLLATRAVALVGSREINEKNAEFAERVGYEAARQGYTLVSGNAHGADIIAQESCLKSGGRVISFVADDLSRHPSRENILYISEDGFDEPFSTQRALSRNRCIHSLAEKTFVAQSSLRRGGTWDGTVKNLRFHQSDVFVFCDGSEAFDALIAMGANGVETDELCDISALRTNTLSFFDAENV